jgi:hypothetical protein
MFVKKGWAATCEVPQAACVMLNAPKCGCAEHMLGGSICPNSMAVENRSDDRHKCAAIVKNSRKQQGP